MFSARRWGGLAALVLGALALDFTVRVAWSDWVSRDGTREQILKAIRMEPENWTFYREWGEFVPAEGVTALSGAVLRNPLNPELRLELADLAEAAGRMDEAEGSLRAAVALDQTSTARTLLARYYFRRNDAGHFWPAVREALAVAATGDPELFRECWAMNTGHAVGDVIPKRPEMLVDYLDFLVDSQRYDAAAGVGAELIGKKPVVAEEARKRAMGVVMRYCSAMVQQGRAAEAVAAWNWLVGARAIRGEELGVGARVWVTDGEFSWDPGDGAGFEWQRTGAVYTEYGEKAREMRVTFSGKQPERCEVMGEYVALWPGREYWVRVKYEMRGVGAESGLRWKVALRDGKVLGEVGMPGGRIPGESGGEREVEMRFRVMGAGPVVGRLTLAYERELGTVRIEGEAAIRKVESGWK